MLIENAFLSLLFGNLPDGSFFIPMVNFVVYFFDFHIFNQPRIEIFFGLFRFFSPYFIFYLEDFYIIVVVFHFLFSVSVKLPGLLVFQHGLIVFFQIGNPRLMVKVVCRLGKFPFLGFFVHLTGQKCAQKLFLVLYMLIFLL